MVRLESYILFDHHDVSYSPVQYLSEYVSSIILPVLNGTLLFLGLFQKSIDFLLKFKSKIYIVRSKIYFLPEFPIFW